MRAALITGLLAQLALASCLHIQPRDEGKLARYEFTEPQMGVPFRMVLYAEDQGSAERAARAAFDRIRELNHHFSDYEDDSELSLLSRSSDRGEETPVSPELWTILEQAQTLAKQTHGAFDVTVGRYVQLWRRARRIRELPDAPLLAEARAAVGYDKMKLNPRRRTVQLLAPGMRLDLGGIAKGAGVDAALEVLRGRGIRRALVAGDGDIAVGDPPPQREGWTIAVAPLDVPNPPPSSYVILKNAAISTSGDLSQRLEIGGRRYSHIVDPRTGLGLTDHSLVTVIARNSRTADSLATAISVLGPVEGLKLARSMRGVEVRIVRQPREKVEIHESPGFKRYAEGLIQGSDR